MKAIVSHDIDHIKVWEHLTKDVIIPKFIVRSEIELFTGKISISEFSNRIGDLFRNRWHRVPELIKFNAEMNVPATFFIGVENGVGLSYSLSNSTDMMKLILNEDAVLGIHGIAYDNQSEIDREKKIFAENAGLKNFGIRMHYVRMTERTLGLLNNAGYTYDSSLHGMINPYKVGNMWEFPFQIMDGWVIENGKAWQSRNLQQSIDATKIIIEEANQKGIQYLGIDFHDRYFSNSFVTWKKWYEWIIAYLHENKIEMVNFDQAIKELESKESMPA